MRSNITNINIIGGNEFDEDGNLLEYHVFGKRGLSNVKVGQYINGKLTIDSELVDNLTEKEVEKLYQVSINRIKELEDFIKNRSINFDKNVKQISKPRFRKWVSRILEVCLLSSIILFIVLLIKILS